MVLIKVFLLDCFIVAEIFIVLTKAVTIPIIKVASTGPNPNFSPILKVHIKYEKRKNVAITLSIKDLKGLLEAA